jgi:hypothetical protein
VVEQAHTKARLLGCGTVVVQPSYAGFTRVEAGIASSR